MKKIKEISFFKPLSIIGSLMLVIFILTTIILPVKASANDPEVSITTVPSSIPLDTKTNVKITWTMSGFDFSDGDSCTLTMPEGGIYSRTNDGSMMEPITFNSSDSSRVYSIKCYKKGKRYSASASVGATCVVPVPESCPSGHIKVLNSCVKSDGKLTVPLHWGGSVNQSRTCFVKINEINLSNKILSVGIDSQFNHGAEGVHNGYSKILIYKDNDFVAGCLTDSNSGGPLVCNKWSNPVAGITKYDFTSGNYSIGLSCAGQVGSQVTGGSSNERINFVIP